MANSVDLDKVAYYEPPLRIYTYRSSIHWFKIPLNPDALRMAKTP